MKPQSIVKLYCGVSIRFKEIFIANKKKSYFDSLHLVECIFECLVHLILYITWVKNIVFYMRRHTNFRKAIPVILETVGI